MSKKMKVLFSFLSCFVLCISGFAVPVHAETVNLDDFFGGGGIPPGFIAIWNQWIAEGTATMDEMNQGILDKFGFSSVSAGSGGYGGGGGGGTRSFYTGTGLSTTGGVGGGGGGGGTRGYTVSTHNTGRTVSAPVVQTVNNNTVLNIPTSTYNSTTNNYYNQYDIKNTYYSNTYNTYLYETTNNYNYYITYAPTYINVTYMEYSTQTMSNEVYFYQMPDGRNSYDLTASDVFGEYFVYDVANYNCVVEDERTLFLLHMDDDTQDSSSYGQILKWQYGASIAYSDSGPFGSALVGVHGSPRVFLSSGFQTVGTGDFTLEMRLYFTQNYSTSGGYSAFCGGGYRSDNKNPLMPRDVFLNIVTHGNSTSVYLGLPNDTYNTPASSLYRVPFGQWFSVAVVRENGVLNYYFNGVRFGRTSTSSFSYDDVHRQLYMQVGGSSYSSSTGNVFTLYDSTFMVDELRLSSGALYSENYTPSKYPFDTNNVFVLPDEGAQGQIVVASSASVSNTRFGGVRPTYPVFGDVYVSLDSSKKVSSVQQYYNGSWNEVQASIYDGGEWKDLSKYDMTTYTLEPSDFPDDGGGTGGSGGSGTGSGTGDGEDEGGGLWGWVSDKIFGALGDLLGGIIKGLIKVVVSLVDGIVTLIGSLFDAFFSLLDFGGDFGGFLTSALGFVPPEIVSLLTLGLSLAIIAMIIRFFRG